MISIRLIKTISIFNYQSP